MIWAFWIDCTLNTVFVTVLPNAINSNQPLLNIGYRFISSNCIEPLVLNIDSQDTAMNINTLLLCNDPKIIADSPRQGLSIERIFELNMQAFEDKDDFVPILQKHWRQDPLIYLYYLQHSQKAGKVQVVIKFLLEKTGK